jgi:hypothetical protein
MRPPGYVRPSLPFDSIDHLLEAAGVDAKAWRGVHVLVGWADEAPPENADTRPINRHRKPVLDLARRHT